MSLSGSKGVVAVWKIESSNRPKCPIENHRESGTLEGYRPELNRAGFEPDSDFERAENRHLGPDAFKALMEGVA